MDPRLQAFERLLNIMDELREKCPWDRKQTMETLRPLTIEETYELGDAILNNDLEEVKKELGKNHQYFSGNTVFCWGGRFQNTRDRPVNIATGLAFVLPSGLFFGFS